MRSRPAGRGRCTASVCAAVTGTGRETRHCGHTHTQSAGSHSWRPLQDEEIKLIWLRLMEAPSTRKRPSSSLQAAALVCSRSAGPAQTEVDLPKSRFHLDLWLCFTLQNWVLDVGRPVAMLVLPADWFPLNRPDAADFLHFLYNISTPLALLKMLERSPRTLSRPAVRLGIIAVVMGTSLHLVADSVTRRLQLIGYQLHLPVRENPVMKRLKPSELVDAFELLFYYDDTLGHLMWYVPLFLVLFLFFSGCFRHRTQTGTMPAAAWMLLVPNAAYYWFLIAEGQTFILFIFTFFAMTATVMHQRRRGFVPDSNGLLMLYSFSAALVLVSLWVATLWSDGVLRRKHPGLIYVPQPRAVFSLRRRPSDGGTPRPPPEAPPTTSPAELGSDATCP